VVAAVLAAAVGVSVYTLVTALTVPGWHSHVPVLAYLLSGALTIGFVRRGWVAAATHVFVAVTWMSGAGFLLREGHTSGHLGIFFVAIVLGGLLRGPMSALVYGVMSAACLLAVRFAVEAGALTPQPTGEEPWMEHTPQLIVVGALTAMLVRGLHQTLQQLSDSHEALLQSQDMLSTMVEGSPDGILMFNAEERCEVANPAARRMLERSEGDVLGMSVDALGLGPPGGLNPDTTDNGMLVCELTTVGGGAGWWRPTPIASRTARLPSSSRWSCAT